MINKIKEQIIFRKNFKKNFKKVEAEIIELRKTHSIFTLFAENTGWNEILTRDLEFDSKEKMRL